MLQEAAVRAVERCRTIATYSEEPGRITRTFLSPPMRDVHAFLREHCDAAGLVTRIDPAGNLRASRGPAGLVIGSHLDTVPDAGAFDGILGVLLGLALAELTASPLEVAGFSEEEGVRFGLPFIGSRAFIGDPITRDDVQQALREYGLPPDAGETTGAKAYLEFHIEQGPVLESLNCPIGVVNAIAGQSRLDVTFRGQSNHAGTTPMALRQDALAAAAEWILDVEGEARRTPGLVATVGRVEAHPNVRNAINGTVVASLDVRHAEDAVRAAAVATLLGEAHRRGLPVTAVTHLDQPAVAMHAGLTRGLAEAAGPSTPVLTSGAGHDAMIVARRLPTAMLFLRSPGGISHHPDEAVLVDDVVAALATGVRFLETWEANLV